jgi:S-formylglutathione hydrolase
MHGTEQHHCFGGVQHRYRHWADTLGCEMHVSVFMPPNWRPDSPVLYWLSGLTCTDENFVQKAGAQRRAAELGLVVVAPDTSPRGTAVADDPAYDLGQGAGFYVDASEQPWQTHYRMESYITGELPSLLGAQLGLQGRCGVSGHSMGGHGALTLALRHPQRYASVSAFSPIANPSACPWGEKALGAYLGADRQRWLEHDASVLLARQRAPWPILVDVGTADPFLDEQLRPAALEAAAQESGSTLQLTRREGYDHSYFFVASFIDQHLDFHARMLAHR